MNEQQIEAHRTIWESLTPRELELEHTLMVGRAASRCGITRRPDREHALQAQTDPANTQSPLTRGRLINSPRTMAFAERQITSPPNLAGG